MTSWINDVFVCLGISVGFYLAAFIIFDGIKHKKDWLYNPEKRKSKLFMPHKFHIIRKFFGIKGLEIYLIFWAIVGLITPIALAGYLVFKYWSK